MPRPASRTDPSRFPTGRMRAGVPFAAALLVLMLALPAAAGQVEITVGGAFGEFAPTNGSASLGDQIVWIWAAGNHTVTSGVAATLTYDGNFRSSSNPLGNAGKQFSFRPLFSTGTYAYFCYPQASGATVYVTPSGSAAANLRITEVEFAGSGDLDRVQVTNFGNAAASLGYYRISSQTGVSARVASVAASIAPAAGLTIHLAASGTNTSTDVYSPTAASLGGSGSFALYVPNNTTVAEGSSIPGSLTDPNQIVDYVEWGTPGQPAPPNEITASNAAKWSTGDVVDVSTLPDGGTGYSISFCGSATDRSSLYWKITTPNFGAYPVCTTPTRRTTWGEVQARYR